MHRDNQTEVLVVGAGPVGMLTALLLAKRGIEATIIDEHGGTAAHSYACALHPRTLSLLDQVGLARDVLRSGSKIETLAFYEGTTRRAEISLTELPVEFPFLLVLPQSALENLLERKLHDQARIKINWHHRLSALRSEGQFALATIDKLVESAKGYSVADWEMVIDKRLQMKAAFVVGADGHHSLVRKGLGLELESVAAPEMFAVYEFDSNAEFNSEVRIVLDERSTNVLWPVSEGRCRWSFQWPSIEAAGEFPEKESMAVLLNQPQVEEESREHVRTFVRERAPWFKGSVLDIDWATEVQFEPALVTRWGQDHCWLVGDAAHQTGPVGVQSMNVGLTEAEELANALHKILRQNGSPDLLQQYQRGRRTEWMELLGLNGGLTPNGSANPWAAKHAAKILPCLPASGEDLRRIAAQLGLHFPRA